MNLMRFKSEVTRMHGTKPYTFYRRQSGQQTLPFNFFLKKKKEKNLIDTIIYFSIP